MKTAIAITRNMVLFIKKEVVDSDHSKWVVLHHMQTISVSTKSEENSVRSSVHCAFAISTRANNFMVITMNTKENNDLFIIWYI